MSEFLELLPYICLCHFICSGWHLNNVCKEDQGIKSDTPPKFWNKLLNFLMYIPSIGNYLFTYTVGLFDHFLISRISEKYVKASDRIEWLEKQNEELTQRVKNLNQYLEQEHNYRRYYERYLFRYYNSSCANEELPKCFEIWKLSHDFREDEALDKAFSLTARYLREAINRLNPTQEEFSFAKKLLSAPEELNESDFDNPNIDIQVATELADFISPYEGYRNDMLPEKIPAVDYRMIYHIF